MPKKGTINNPNGRPTKPDLKVRAIKISDSLWEVARQIGVRQNSRGGTTYDASAGISIVLNAYLESHPQFLSFDSKNIDTDFGQ